MEPNITTFDKLVVRSTVMKLVVRSSDTYESGTRTLTAGPIAVMILVRLPDQYSRRNRNVRPYIVASFDVDTDERSVVLLFVGHAHTHSTLQYTGLSNHTQLPTIYDLQGRGHYVTVCSPGR